MDEMSNLQSVLVQEFTVSCDMVKLAIENIDASIWSTKQNEWSYVQTLYHIIDTIEFYSYDGPKDLVKTSNLGIHGPNLSKDEVDELIDTKTKEFFFDYLEKVKKLIINTIQSFSVEELLTKDKFSEWGFTSRYHKFSYTLRHTMLHTGELNKNLRDLNKTRIKWL